MSDLIARQQAQTALLTAIRRDPSGHWKSGRAVKALRAAGIHPVSPGTAARHLQALTTAGHLVRHGTPGCVWYTAVTR
jgi:hypothetical protein